MKIKLVSIAAFSLVLAGVATAQNSALDPITVPVKQAGTYHVATGTWSRGVGQLALAGPEVIYDNTCSTGYYMGVNTGEVILDSGRVPSTTSPNWATSLTGLYDRYETNGFQLAYCSATPLTVDMDVSFYDCYAACDNPTVIPQPLRTLNLLNFPAAPPAGGLGCWIVTIDLANSPDVFQLGGDCDGVYDNVPRMDSFAWSWVETSAGGAGNSGPLIAGDPLGFFGPACPIGAGTTFPGAGLGAGSGMGELDQYQLGGTVAVPGCYWFGGYSAQNPMAAFYLRLQGDQAPAASSGVAFCFGDGTGATCPCTANGASGEGCANTTGSGALLSATGIGSFSNDTLQLNVSGVPGSKPGLLLRGDNQVAILAGDGILCTSGASQRSHVQVTAAGATTFTNFAGAPFGSVANMGVGTYFQFWYRDPMNTCSGAGFNFTNGWSVTYRP